MVSLFSLRKHARDQSTALTAADHFQHSSNDSGPISHDVQTHSLLIGRRFRYPRTVVPDAENSAAIYARKRDSDPAGMAVFDGVVNSLLRDAIQMISGCVIVNRNRVIAFEPADDLKKIFHFAGPMLEGRHQPKRIGMDRQQPARQLAGLVNSFVHQLYDLSSIRGLR